MHTVLLFSLVFLACTSAPRHTGKLPVNRIISVSSINRTVTFTVVATVPEAGCWAYDHYESTGKVPVDTVTVFGRRTTDGACPQVLGTIEPSFQYLVPGSGTYTVRFWTWDSTFVDTTFTVPTE